SFGSTSLALSVTQPLYRRQNTIVYEQAFTQVEQADAQLALAAQDLILRVAQAYFDVLLAQDNVAFAQAQKAAIGQQLEHAKRSNLQVRVARSGLTFANQEIARNRGAHFPTVDAFASVSEAGLGAQTTTNLGTDTRSAVIGFQVAVPLYQGGLINSRVRE